jgi:hypothetical protein
MPGPARQIAAAGVAAGQRHLARHQRERQGFLARALQKAFHQRVLGKRQGLLREVEALDLRAVLARPVHVGRRIDEVLVHVGAAHAAAAAQGGVKNLDGAHGELLVFGAF